MNEVHCCADRLYARADYKCINNEMIPIPDSEKLPPPIGESYFRRQSETTTAQPTWTRPELIGDPNGNQQLVRCQDRTITASVMYLVNLACCGNFLFNMDDFDCDQGGRLVAKPSRGTKSSLATELDLPEPLPEISWPGVAFQALPSGSSVTPKSRQSQSAVLEDYNNLPESSFPPHFHNGKHGNLKMGPSLPGNRRIVKCGSKAYTIKEVEVSKYSCCGREMYEFEHSECINGVVFKRIDGDNDQLPELEPSDFLTDGRRVAKCGKRRFLIPKDKVENVRCCREIAFNGALAYCINGTIIESGKATGTGQMDDGFQPNVVNAILGRPVYQCPDQKAFMLKNPNSSVLCCGESVYNTDKFRCIEGFLVQKRKFKSAHFGSSKFDDDPFVYIADDRELSKIMTASGELKFSMDGQSDYLPVSSSRRHDATDGGPKGKPRGKETPNPNNLLMSSLAVASGLAQGVFTLRCNDMLWQTRGPPVFYVCCGAKLQDLMQTCSENTTQPVMEDYEEEGTRMNSLQTLENMAEEDQLFNLFLKQQAESGKRGEQLLNKILSIELSPTDHEYSPLFNIGSTFDLFDRNAVKSNGGNNPSLFNFRPLHSSITNGKRQLAVPLNKKQCPSDKFCCGGFAHAKTMGQVSTFF